VLEIRRLIPLLLAMVLVASGTCLYGWNLVVQACDGVRAGTPTPTQPGETIAPESAGHTLPGEGEKCAEDGGHGPLADSGESRATLPPNELGAVPILMYHQLGEVEAPWVRSYDNFRSDLARLHRRGYMPVPLTDYLRANINLPAGATPVVITFDDARASQLSWEDEVGGELDPNCAVAIMLEYARQHPDFNACATFFVNTPRPFCPFSQDDSDRTLSWLVSQGFEVGNHVAGHADLSKLDPAEAQRVIAQVEESVSAAIWPHRMNSLALPFGQLPRDRELARRGEWQGARYNYEAVLLVGAGPAPSPFSTEFDPTALPRIQACDSELGRWLGTFERHPERRYVSDGKPGVISAPQDWLTRLAPQFRGRCPAAPPAPRPTETGGESS